jgi:hypothetical protein
VAWAWLFLVCCCMLIEKKREGETSDLMMHDLIVNKKYLFRSKLFYFILGRRTGPMPT